MMKIVFPLALCLLQDANAFRGKPNKISNAPTFQLDTSSSLAEMEAVVAKARHRVAIGAPPQAQAGSCSLMGGLLSTNLSATCCFSVNVVAQRTLHSYGLAYPCTSQMECEKDGVTPTASFELKAVDHVCTEPHCYEYVVSAMKANWMTKKGADSFSHLCVPGADKQTPVATVGGKDASAKGYISAFRGAVNVTGNSTKRINGTLNATISPGSDEWKACQEDNCKTDKDRDAFCKKDAVEEDECFEVCCKQASLVCFPGNALVRTRVRGDVAMSTLRTSEDVLVEGHGGKLEFAPVLGFIHAQPEVHARYVSVVHEKGRLQVSHNHLVFVMDADGNRVDRLASQIKLGESVFTAEGASVVVDIQQSKGAHGMFAPLTPTGTIVVDGVVASNYASPVPDAHLPHSLAHFALFPLRLYHQLGLAKFGSSLCEVLPSSSLCGDHEYHPYVYALYKALSAPTMKMLSFA